MELETKVDAMMFKHCPPIESGHRLLIDPVEFKQEMLDLLRAAATVPTGMVRVGVEDLKLLGTLTKTNDGAVCGGMFSPIWCIHRSTGKVYESTPYHAGIKGGYSTEEAALVAALAAKKTKGST